MTEDTHSPPAATRIALALEYDGSAFSGWQKQSSPELATVQGALESALSQIADCPISSHCAGRTDAGVHATCQVVHFDSPVDRGDKAWTQGVNSLLPASVRVLWSQPVSGDFHARFSARHRRYFYILHRRRFASAVLAGKVTHWRGELDVAALNAAAACLPGEQDFSAFRAAGCQSRSPFRNIHHARWFEQGDYLVFDVQANAFLQHMVRNLVGSMLEVGQGKRPAGWMAELIAAADRRQSGIAAPADGLYLAGVGYPQEDLPPSLWLPPMLANLPALNQDQEQTP